MSKLSIRYLYPFKAEKDIIHAVELGDQIGITLVDTFFDYFKQESVSNSHYLRKVGLQLLNCIFKFCSDKNIDSVEINTYMFEKFDQVNQAKSLDRLKAEIKAVIQEILNHLHNQSNNNHFVQQGLAFIHEHVCEDINLQILADYLCISPAYFSFLFKQQMKVNFVNYLNQYRINLAKELLADVRLKNYEVAYRVGYQDEKYFYRLFKRITGITPSQYRTSIRKGD